MRSSSDARIFPILQILYPNLNYKTTTFHIDHIYPKSKFNEKNEKLDKDFYKCKDFLYNLQLLEGQENSAKKDKDPEVWLKEEYNNEQAIEEYKKRNYIDPTLKLEWENIKEFRETREEAIIKKLKEEFYCLSLNGSVFAADLSKRFDKTGKTKFKLV
ncbi:hypothetical protein ID0985_13080 [Helicobacter pylori]